VQPSTTGVVKRLVDGLGTGPHLGAVGENLRQRLAYLLRAQAFSQALLYEGAELRLPGQLARSPTSPTLFGRRCAWRG
jgi:hypothetical protein